MQIPPLRCGMTTVALRDDNCGLRMTTVALRDDNLWRCGMTTCGAARCQRVALRDDKEQRCGTTNNRKRYAAGYSFNDVTSTVTAGYFSFIPSIASARMLEMATFRYHLLSEGITNHGACLWLVSSKISS